MWKQTVKAPGDRPKAPQQERQTSPNHPCFRCRKMFKGACFGFQCFGCFFVGTFLGVVRVVTWESSIRGECGLKTQLLLPTSSDSAVVTTIGFVRMN